MKNIIILLTGIFFFSCSQTTENKDINKDTNKDARSKIVKALEINNKIKNQTNIQYKDVTIIGDIDFLFSEDANFETPYMYKHHISSFIIFYNCTFKGKIIGYKKVNDVYKVSNFEKNLTFMNCTFQDTVNFKYADFNGLVNMSKSTFQEFVSFESCNFNFKKNYFSQAKFLKQLRFNLVFARGDINFFEAVFDDNVLFQLSKFNNPVTFSSSKFNKNADFTSCKFYDDIFLNYAEFLKKISFNNTVFKGRTEFIDSKFNFISEFKNCIYFGKTKYNNSTVKGVFSFENSYFYVSNPKNFSFNLENGSYLVLDKVKVFQNINLKDKKTL